MLTANDDTSLDIGGEVKAWLNYVAADLHSNFFAMICGERFKDLMKL